MNVAQQLKLAKSCYENKKYAECLKYLFSAKEQGSVEAKRYFSLLLDMDPQFKEIFERSYYSQMAKDSLSRIRDGEYKPGDKIVRGRYEVIGIVGRGGMGVVYRCHDTVTRMDVALKTLPPEIACSQDEIEGIRTNFLYITFDE